MQQFPVIDVPSPNHGERRGAVKPDMVVLHYTGMTSARAAVDRLCDPNAEVSAHYVIEANGAVMRLVAEERRAWHAGASRWGGVQDVNSHSIGLEIVNPGHFGGYPPIAEPQMTSIERVLGDILERWSILPERVVGHACVAPGRKIDPGEKLDWRRLSGSGMAVWLEPDLPDTEAEPDAARFAEAARTIGYDLGDCADPEGWTEELRHVWGAVAMRFLRLQRTSRPFMAGIEHIERVARCWPVVDPQASCA